MRKRHIGRVMAAGLAAVVAYVLGGCSRHRRWGTTGVELYAPMPGDELVLCPAMSATHAITVDVPADGCGRGWPSSARR
jgi:hypothetical protein